MQPEHIQAIAKGIAQTCAVPDWAHNPEKEAAVRTIIQRAITASLESQQIYQLTPNTKRRSVSKLKPQTEVARMLGAYSAYCVTLAVLGWARDATEAHDKIAMYIDRAAALDTLDPDKP